MLNSDIFLGLNLLLRKCNLTLAEQIVNLGLNYQKNNQRFQFKVGQIKNLTFGHGMLIKRYTVLNKGGFVRLVLKFYNKIFLITNNWHSFAANHYIFC